jgi:hypothetical protein
MSVKGLTWVEVPIDTGGILADCEKYDTVGILSNTNLKPVCPKKFLLSGVAIQSILYNINYLFIKKRGAEAPL